MAASLDWLIALTLIFALLSLLATALQEWLASRLELGAKTLRKGIEALLGASNPAETTGANRHKDPVQGVFDSHFVRAMRSQPGKNPSYLASPLFAQAFISHLRDLRARSKNTATTIVGTADLLAGLPDSSPAKKVLLQVTDQGMAGLAVLKREIALYFDAGLERASGWFISALAISFGAPFWFDPLGKFVRIRSATVPKDTFEREASENKPTPAN